MFFHFPPVNVESQERAEDSLLTRLRRLIAVRRQHPAFSRGTIEFLDSGNDEVLAFLRRYADETLVVAVNLAASPQQAALFNAGVCRGTDSHRDRRRGLPAAGRTRPVHADARASPLLLASTRR